MTVGEAFLSAFLQVLFDRLASRELLDVATSLKIDTDLKKLTLLVSKLNAVLKDAEEKQDKDMAIKLWIDELRDVADDAEDALDEFATVILECKLKAGNKKSRSWTELLQDMLRPNTPVGAVIFNAKVAFKFDALTQRLEDFAKQTKKLGLREHAGEKSIGLWRRFETTSLVADCVYGRVEDAKNLIELLREVDDGLSVIPLIGLAGIGKTTLAQIVYNDKEVNGDFDLKAWVYVSGDFDLVRMMKGILDSLGESCHSTDLEPLQSILRKKLMEKKILLVFDDLWNENCSEWDVLQLPFRACKKGSKIIVTTRNENVAQTISTGPVFYLQELSENDCWSLFAQHAFSKLNCKVRPDLESTGKEIAKKCKGLPLAAKALGGLLSSKSDTDEWHHILNSEVWELPYQKCGILPGLSLSYYHLPSHLKPCFAYCAIFPKGYKFNEKELVRLWIAEGLVQQPQRNDMQIEDVGSQYFHDLLSRSLFQRSNGIICQFTMHDLINDLAQFAAGERCLRLEDNINRYKNGKKARHLSHISQKRDSLITFESFSSQKCLQTFLPLDGGFGIRGMTNKATSELLKTFTRLRVLSLKQFKITELPDLIGELKRLRYLDLSSTLIKVLPESITTLYNLQTLLLHNCHNLAELPRDMGNLVNLRELDIRGTDLRQFPPHMGRLENLRTLPYFIVSRDAQNDGGSDIVELKDLSNIQGDLRLCGLECVEKDTDAVTANLLDKKYLNKLVLEWISDFDGMMVEDVLNALQPHRNLKELSIKHYSGEKFSNWTADPSFSNLMFIGLSNCKNCKSLPPLGQLPSLKDLIIERMDAVRKVGPEFYGASWCSVRPFKSLETLKFKDMPVWEEWCSVSDGEFPYLHELCIENCPKLSDKMPESFGSLKSLEIRNCIELYLIPRLPQIQNLVLIECDQAILETVGDLTSLEKLLLHKVLRLKHLPNELFHRLTALSDLEIGKCDELSSLFNQFGLLRNPCLKRLKIWECSLNLLWREEEYGLPHLLVGLEISDCKNLTSLPEKLHSLKSLKTLKITNCPRLVLLPEMEGPSSLRHLQIKECEALQSLPNGLMHNENLSLEVLEIDGCSSLKGFTKGELPLTLQKLKISNCSNLNVLPKGLLSKNTCLESLQISGCSLTSFPVICPSPLQSFVPSSSSSSSRSSSSPSLKVLEVRDCINLESLPVGLHNSIHLDTLLISNCSILESFPDGGLPPNLTTLSISRCANLQELPNGMYTNTLLQDLTIRDCIRLTSYPEGGLPPNLQSLRIIRCYNLNHPSQWDLYKLRSVKKHRISNDP
ncbi:hypothetical protein Ddye_031752 [Dipteronia dyeriana]|uniref:Disease resistance RPP13-like protein 1 n=1 Tax=Dipteronia dyeriana TaxID=168575 RepID=A0AAD9WP15_9ROSI|nr:hypothetical protein Ddye_031752 [Dipteronia dyeriana]